jgi:hypothetical protein
MNMNEMNKNSKHKYYYQRNLIELRHFPERVIDDLIQMHKKYNGHNNCLNMFKLEKQRRMIMNKRLAKVLYD